VLQLDTQYREWLMSQSWFRDKYQPIYNFIVNNFGEAADTPEHNILQAKFLKDKVCYNIAKKFKNDALLKSYEAQIGWLKQRPDCYFYKTDETCAAINKRLSIIRDEIKG